MNAFSHNICPKTLADLAHSHLQTAKGEWKAIDPFEPMRASGNATPNPNEFETDFFALLEELKAEEKTRSIEKLKQKVESFQSKWSIEDSIIRKLFLPYRQYRNGKTVYETRYSKVLKKLISDEVAQRLLLEERFENLLKAHPKLQERFTYYRENAGKSVLEMAEELRSLGDNEITEEKVRSELHYFNLSIERNFQRHVTPSELAEINEQIKIKKGQVYISAYPRLWNVIRHSLSQNIPSASLSEILRVTPQAIEFFSHFNGFEFRKNNWKRLVRSESGRVCTEETLLKQLLKQSISQSEIAKKLNEAFARHINENILSSDRRFRTLESVSAKISKIQPSKKINSKVKIPPYGLVKSNGRLKFPQALNYVQAQREKKIPHLFIAKSLKVNIATLKRFLNFWSEEPVTKLPAVFGRFKSLDLEKDWLKRKNAHEKRKAWQEWVGVIPPPGKNKNFDSFEEAFEKGTMGWNIASKTNFLPLIKALSNKFSNWEQIEWERTIGLVSAYTGIVAKGSEPQKRTSRFYIYQLLKDAIERYNRTHRNKLKITLLRSPDGIKHSLETLSGVSLETNVLLHASSLKENGSFESFYEVFPEGLSGWKGLRPLYFKSEMKKMARKIPSPQREEWLSKIKYLSPQTAVRAMGTGRSHRSYRLIFFNFFEDAVVSRKEKKLLTSGPGIRTLVERLSGSKLNPNLIALKYGKKTPTPKENPLFDDFENSFLEGTEEWPITLTKNFPGEIKKLGTHFNKTGKETWTRIQKGLKPSIGGHARRTNSNHRKFRYLFFNLFQEAIELYNQNNPPSQLSTNDLRTPGGIKKIIQTLSF